MTTCPIEVAAFEAANTRAYLSALFEAWAGGQCVMSLPAGDARRSVPGTKVLTRRSFRPDHGWFEAPLPDCQAETRALVTFSSGTTGRPKAILLPHRALQDVVTRINAAMGVDETLREYLGVPVNYSFGFGRVRAVSAAGGSAYLPEHGFDPSEIGAMLAKGEINAVSAVPTLWRVLLANRDVVPSAAARNMRWIEIGSQWMSGTEKRDLRELFPNARIVQHYGLTEASRTALLDVSEAPVDRLDSIGREGSGVDIEIDGDGRIRTRGAHIAEGVVSGAGVRRLVDAEGWLTTSDRGRVEDGWLFFEGRIDEQINIGGIKIDPAAFEQAVNATLDVPGAVAASSLRDRLRGEKVLITLQASAGLNREAVADVVAAEASRFGLTGGAFELREVEAFPLTGTGKIKRAELSGLPEIRRSEGQAASNDQAASLQALWAEILGLESVPVDKSFYDVGGDSLSALNAILRMEALGVEVDTARGIFEGRTIAEIAGTKANAANGELAGLKALWGEILDLEDVPTDKSFYDLGGDSLSALTAILRMEALGIEAEIARGIFEGRTIADLAGDPTSEPDAPPEPDRSLTLAEAVNSIHAARGVLVLWVVLVHWLPALLVRIDPTLIERYIAAIPAWRLGTPGFAMVFGMGIGALGLHHYASNRELFLRNNGFNTRLILVGVLILALSRFFVAMAEGTLGDRLVISGFFYSAISFYALAMLSLPLIVWGLSRGKNRLLTILITAVGAALLHILLYRLLAHHQPPAALETIKLLLTAKYGFFRMLSFVMVGVAIGWLFRRHHGEPGLLRQLWLYGLLLIGAGTLGAIQSGAQMREFGHTHLWHLSIYAGVVLMVLGGFAWLNRGPRKPIPSQFNAFFIASGLLALPIFVGHEVVFALKQLFDAFAVPDIESLTLLLGLFFAALIVGYRRLWPLLGATGLTTGRKYPRSERYRPRPDTRPSALR